MPADQRGRRQGDRRVNVIATAPQERNLEVRVNDRIGRYRVLYPCRLVPGTGWINVVVKRKLTMEPVEWRDWPEDRPDFG